MDVLIELVLIYDVAIEIVDLELLWMDERGHVEADDSQREDFSLLVVDGWFGELTLTDLHHDFRGHHPIILVDSPNHQSLVIGHICHHLLIGEFVERVIEQDFVGAELKHLLLTEIEENHGREYTIDELEDITLTIVGFGLRTISNLLL